MDFKQILLEMPILGILFLTVMILFVSFEGGFYIGRHRLKRKDKEKDSLAGPMVASILGLLAFMLSFSFGVAAQHFSVRRHLVLDEANAIRGAYEMTGFLADDPRDESKKLLREYVDIRVELISSPEKLMETVARSNEIQDKLWTIVMADRSQNRELKSSWLYAQSLVDMFSIQTKRLAMGTHGKIQPIIWFVLFGLAMGGMSAMGYHAGLVGMRGFFVYQVLILTFSMVLVLIYDLDRPKQELFKVEQYAMQYLQKRISE